MRAVMIAGTAGMERSISKVLTGCVTSDVPL